MPVPCSIAIPADAMVKFDGRSVSYGELLEIIGKLKYLLKNQQKVAESLFAYLYENCPMTPIEAEKLEEFGLNTSDHSVGRIARKFFAIAGDTWVVCDYCLEFRGEIYYVVVSER